MSERVPGLSRVDAAALIARRTGLPIGEAKLRYWEHLKLLSPLPAECRGPHYPATYRLPDLVAVEIFATLRLSGASLQRLRRGLKHLERLMPGILDAPGAWRLAVTNAGDVVRIEDDKAMLELTRRPGQLAIYDAGALATDARRVLEHKKRAA